ncbi:methylenetetrahydrofolate reductase-domain-containing protein [Syncephalis fuscata]|nr:methylenetetrahydrofolate reductase-domain-containing protein [Syncephalis fuscata]
MKITQKIQRAEAENRPYWSFEYFPPKTQQGLLNLYDRMERMYRLGPEFIDVTWGAGGSTSELTLDICGTAQTVYGLETCMHLTCTCMPKEKVDDALKECKNNGIQNILALRGDPPRGQDTWEACEGGFVHAADLVRYIREHYGEYFCIGVAGYPEGHSESEDKELDMKYLKEKIDAGADYIVTQLFYDTDLFIDWVKKCRASGIQCPILPGIMPIQNFNGFKRMTTLSQTFVPQAIYDSLEPIKEDDQAVKDFGIQLAIEMCQKMNEHGISGFHFYTMNLERSIRLILEGLGWVAPIEITRPLPWNPSKSKKREKEGVRPIFWKNRARSYVQRTESWDEFPNGRWGDSSSPAFGELDGYGASIKQSRQDAIKLWQHPTTPSDVATLFSRYCLGDLSALPWNKCHSYSLVKTNNNGYLTINSQPAVNGVKSSDRMFGWGPKNGYVYQKAYLEFFVSPEKLSALLERIEKDPYLTFHAVNREGILRTNVEEEVPNAVTWGVFPGKEIVQPTIVETASFLAWKDEAFQLWLEWSNIYECDSESSKLLKEIANTWYLVNLVNNDFQASSDAIFSLFATNE